MSASGRWYAINTFIGRESRTKKLIEKMGFDDIEVCNFSRNVTEKKESINRMNIRTVFPGYLFLKGDLDAHKYISINGLNDVIGFVCEDKLPVSVEDVGTIALLEKAVMYQDNSLPESIISIHERGVRVLDGPLTGLEEMIEKTALRKKRVYVSLSLFGNDHIVSMPAMMAAV